MKLRAGILWALFILAFGFQNVQAQMFSVESKKKSQPTRWNQSVYVTVAPLDFSYQGADDVQFAGDYELNGITVGLRYEIPGFDIYLNLGGGLTGMNNHSLVNVGAQLYQPFRLVNTKVFDLYAPLQLHTDFTRVVADNQRSGADQFQQSMLAPGAGLIYDVKFGDRVSYLGSGVAEYGYSFAAGNTFVGQVFGVQVQQRLTISNVFGSVGLSFGYDLNYRRYDVEIDRYDYNLLSHNISVGISF
jgi:hypothetical protein